jgi:hypothetical protein
MVGLAPPHAAQGRVGGLEGAPKSLKRLSAGWRTDGHAAAASIAASLSGTSSSRRVARAARSARKRMMQGTTAIAVSAAEAQNAVP